LKKAVSLIVLLITLGSLLFAAEGKLSVFTDNDRAEIYVDEELMGRNYIKNIELNEGSHYLKVVQNGRVIHKERVNIYAGRTETIVVEKFVEMQTDVANRGAVEVEAARIRETRGNTAFGFYGGSPASGLSYKHWFNDRFGVQLIGYSNKKQNIHDSRVGGRILIGLADKVFSNEVFSTYMAIGSGRSYMHVYDDMERNHSIDISEFAFGLEFKVTDLTKSIFEEAPKRKVAVTAVKHEIDRSTGKASAEGVKVEEERFDLGTALALLGIKGLFEFSSVSIELGGERFFKRHYDVEKEEASEELSNTKFSGGFHFYF